MLKISIIVVCLNEEKGIRDTLNSIVNQTYNNYQLIIVDGKSIDNTLNIIHEFKNNIDTLISEKDTGVYFSMNRAIDYISGDIVGFLNGGDRLSNKYVFQDLIKCFKNEEISYVYGDKSYFSKSNKNKIIRRWKVGNIQRKYIKNGWSIPHLSTYIRSNIFYDIGKFNTKFKIAADFDFLLKLISNSDLKYIYLDKYIVEMEQGGISNSSLFNIFLSNYECYKSLVLNNFKPSMFIILLKPLKKIAQLFS